MKIMMSKNINKLLTSVFVGCGIAAVLTSCRFEDEDYFDQPAALPRYRKSLSMPPMAG